MFATTEVRWFYEGKLPDPVADWFYHFNPVIQQPRTDYYLNFTERARVGIKLREENIQIKTRISAFESLRYLLNVAGEAAKYERWSFPVVGNEEWITLINRPDVWIPVKKMRRMMRFTLDGGYPDQIEMEESADNGCEVELSQVEVTGKAYWSLAFESFGPTAEVNLEKTVWDIFENQACPVSFEKERSFGYARLIHEMKN